MTTTRLSSAAGTLELHGVHRSDAVRLRFQDAEGQVFAELELTAAERQRWLAALG
jgi:hypothetical protein